MGQIVESLKENNPEDIYCYPRDINELEDERWKVRGREDPTPRVEIEMYNPAYMICAVPLHASR